MWCVKLIVYLATDRWAVRRSGTRGRREAGGMSSRTSPVNGGYEASSAEPAISMRLSVRKDLFPEVRLPKLDDINTDNEPSFDEEDVSCVKLETDFEQSIDEIANQKQQVLNGALPSLTRSRHRKHKQHSRRDSRINGSISERRRRKSPSDSRHRTRLSNNVFQVKGGKNLNLVSSSEYQEEEDQEETEVESESSEDEVLKFSVKLPVIVPRQSGKPYSHELSQLSTKKSKSKDSSKEKRTYAVTPCSGKPRSMLGICSSRSKKKSKKSECTATYRSQIVGTNSNIKIKIKKTNVKEMVSTFFVFINLVLIN